MIINLFPTPISYIQNFLSSDEVVSLLNYCLQNKDVAASPSLFLNDAVTSHKEHKDFLFDAVSNGDIDSAIYKKLLQEILNYAQASGYGFSKIANSWFNIQNEGSVLTMHRHPQSIISGALYINVDNKSSPLYFCNPNPLPEFAYVNNFTDHGHKLVKVTPENGTLVLFPSWLQHGSHYEQNQTQNRVVISFNTLY